MSERRVFRLSRKGERAEFFDVQSDRSRSVAPGELVELSEVTATQLLSEQPEGWELETVFISEE